MSANSAVFLDVYPWLNDIRRTGVVPKTGVYRHTEALAPRFQPVYFCAETEAPMPDWVCAKAEQALGKPVRCYSSVSNLAGAGCEVWLSTAIDAPAPFITEATPFLKVAILHDTLALEGYFGREKAAIYRRGYLGFDVLLSVSKYAVACLERHARYDLPARAHAPEIVPYGNFHLLQKLPEVPPLRDEGWMGSLFNLYHRKHLDKSMQLAARLKRRLLHVGGTTEEFGAADMLYNSLKNVSFMGTLPDELLPTFYQSLWGFSFLSEAEGFGIPPLEAILYGVRHIYLSPIPAHLEVYESYPVNFVHDPADPRLSYYAITPEARRRAFNDRRFSKVARHALKWLAEV